MCGMQRFVTAKDPDVMHRPRRLSRGGAVFTLHSSKSNARARRLWRGDALFTVHSSIQIMHRCMGAMKVD